MMRRGVLTLVLMLLSVVVSVLPERVKKIICVRPTWEPISEVRGEIGGELGGVTGGVTGGYVAAPQEEGMPLMLVVDTSGSTRTYEYGSELRRLHRELSLSYRVGLVTYADTARLMVRPGGAMPDWDSLPARGGSNLVAGMTESLDWFARAGTGGKIVLVSDGSMNVGEVDPSALIKLASQARARGIVVDVLGLGHPEGTILEDFARATNGTYAMLE